MIDAIVRPTRAAGSRGLRLGGPVPVVRAGLPAQDQHRSREFDQPEPHAGDHRPHGGGGRRHVREVVEQNRGVEPNPNSEEYPGPAIPAAVRPREQRDTPRSCRSQVGARCSQGSREDRDPSNLSAAQRYISLTAQNTVGCDRGTPGRRRIQIALLIRSRPSPTAAAADRRRRRPSAPRGSPARARVGTTADNTPTAAGSLARGLRTRSCG